MSDTMRWLEIGRQTLAELDRDNGLGLAAQLAFYFFLALFPALLFLVALVGYLPLDNTLPELLAALAPVAPEEVLTLLRVQLTALAESSEGGLLTLGILGAVWSSSAALVAIIDALNRAFNVTEARSWWKRRLVAVVLTLSSAVFILLALTLVMIGPGAAETIAAWFGLGRLVPAAWAVTRWPLMVVLVVLGVDLLFHFAPNRRKRWDWFTPGALLSTALWIASSFLFKFYVANMAAYNATYGTIGAVIVLLLWFYVSGLAILVGAELNGVIERRRSSSGACANVART